MNKNSFAVEYSDYCRTCAQKSVDLTSLFVDSEYGRPFTEIVELCTSITLRDDLVKPTSICKNCIFGLKTAYEFYNLVRSSDEKFNEWIQLKSTIKLETNHFQSGETSNTVKLSDIDLNVPKELTSSTEDLCKIEQITDNIFFDEPNAADSSNDEFDQPLHPSDAEVQTNTKRPAKRKSNQRTVPFERKKSTSNTSITEFQCYKCRVKFPSWNKIKSHLRHDNVSKSCRICVKKFTRCEYRQHSCTGADMVCEYCDTTFRKTINLVTHLNAVHKRYRSYKCLKCVRVFHMKLFLDVHEPLHKDNELKFICDICDARFRTKYQIKEHMRLNHMVKTTNLCAICGKNFNSSYSLADHMKRHTQTRSIPCPKCPKQFADKSGLRRHMDVHVDATYTCDLCNKVLRSKGSFQKHKKRHENTKVYTCEICFKQIKTSLHNLKQHMYTHTGEKPFGCPYCDRKYSQNSDLNKHLRTHVGQNTYKCDMCGESFRLLVELRRHTSEHYMANGTAPTGI